MSTLTASYDMYNKNKYYIYWPKVWDNCNVEVAALADSGPG